MEWLNSGGSEKVFPIPFRDGGGYCLSISWRVGFGLGLLDSMWLF
jgi:hypothetical protein